MNKLDDFIAWLLAWVNRAIYVWGGQGETITSIAQINRMETSKVNALRAIVLWVKRGRRAVCFDCSGLIVTWLLSMKLIQYDTTANGLMHMCIKINKSQLRRGDWVFRVRDGKAYHAGVVADADLHVVEAMGRDDGVVMRGIDDHKVKGYWTDYGRPRMFQEEIEYIAPAPTVIACPYVKPTKIYKSGFRIVGNDAEWIIWHLERLGYTNLLKGVPVVGPNAWKDIWDVQRRELNRTGDAGPLTYAALEK